MSNQDFDIVVSDLEYNLVTTLSNLLQSEDVLERYARDADEADEPEIAELFRTLKAQNHSSALQMRNALEHVIARSRQ